MSTFFSFGIDKSDGVAIRYQEFNETMVDYIRYVATTLRYENPMRWSTFGVDTTLFDNVSLPEVENFLLESLRKSDTNPVTNLGQYITNAKCVLVDEGSISCDVEFLEGGTTNVRI